MEGSTIQGKSAKYQLLRTFRKLLFAVFFINVLSCLPGIAQAAVAKGELQAMYETISKKSYEKLEEDARKLDYVVKEKLQIDPMEMDGEAQYWTAAFRSRYGNVVFEVTGCNTLWESGPSFYEYVFVLKKNGKYVFRSAGYSHDGIIRWMRQYRVYPPANGTITFDTVGGKTTTGNKTVAVGKKYGKLPAPKRKGYKFCGWYTAKNGGSKVTSTTQMTSAEDVTLYARWSKCTYTISYRFNGGWGAQDAYYASSYSISSNVIFPKPVRTGYVFKGWYTNSSCKKKYLLKKTKGRASNLILYAKWIPIQYTIRYNANGGTGTMADTKKVKYDSTVGLRKNTFTRSGYSFCGWSTARTGTVRYGDGNNVRNLTSKRKRTVILYAIWAKNGTSAPKPETITPTISLSYDLTGGPEITLAYHSNVNGTVSWQSSNTNVATVNNGVVVAKQEGTAQITAILTYNGMSCSDSRTITVGSSKTYGNWSAWSLTPAYGRSDLDVRTTTMYRYYYFYCPVCGGREPFQGMSDCHQYSLKLSDGVTGWFPVPYSQSNSSTYSYSSAKRYTTSLGDGKIWNFSSGNLYNTAVGTKDTASDAVVIKTGYSTRAIYTNYYIKSIG